MSNVPSVINNLVKLEGKFNKQNNFGLKFETECLFARQQIVKNDFTSKTAQNNPGSLQSAILNVAAIGVSLNPASSHAYLVPRDGGICLDISYKGLVKLATDSGAIEWAKAVLVYKEDEFEMNGVWEPPVHKHNPFSKDRGDIVGGYCLAKLSTGDYMVDTMNFDEMEKIRNTSKASNGPWKTWPDEMRKKSLVKRASKSWPQSNGRDRLDQAVEIINQHEGLQETTIVRTADYITVPKEQTETYLSLAKDGDPVDFWLWYDQFDDSVKSSLPGCEFEKGQKGKTIAVFVAKLGQGRETFEQMKADLFSVCESQDESGVVEILEDLPQTQTDALFLSLSLEHQSFAREAIK